MYFALLLATIKSANDAGIFLDAFSYPHRLDRSLVSGVLY